MRKTIGASESSSIYLIALCAGSLISMFISLLIPRDIAFGGMRVLDWVGYTLMQAAFFASVLIYAKVRRLDEISIARIRRPRDARQFILAPFIAIATILVFLPLANAWISFLNIIGYPTKSDVAMPGGGNVGIYFLALFVMAILPAFGEELLMRGHVLHGLSTKNVWFGILMSALFFSLMHSNPVQTVHQFGLGVTMAITLILTGSLWMTVLVHFFNNFISITLSLYIPQVEDISVQLGYFNWLTGAASVLIGIFLLVLLFFILSRLGDKRGEYRVTEEGIVYDEFTITAILPENVKTNPVKDFFKYFGSLFKKSGWKRTTRVLTRANEVDYRGKAQPMIGVWIALGLSIAYWLYSFISGLIK
mgnify:CR=1 FL=1|jgi:membrane protease YdiL (CAAX protease family)